MKCAYVFNMRLRGGFHERCFFYSSVTNDFLVTMGTNSVSMETLASWRDISQFLSLLLRLEFWAAFQAPCLNRKETHFSYIWISYALKVHSWLASCGLRHNDVTWKGIFCIATNYVCIEGQNTGTYLHQGCQLVVRLLNLGSCWSQRQFLNFGWFYCRPSPTTWMSRYKSWVLDNPPDFKC